VQGSPLPRKFETTVVSNFNKVISAPAFEFAWTCSPRHV
jgi:hypothetical protein